LKKITQYFIMHLGAAIPTPGAAILTLRGSDTNTWGLDRTLARNQKGDLRLCGLWVH